VSGRIGVALCALLAIASPVVARGQGTCEVNNQASCTAVASAAQSLYITITAASRLLVPVGDIVLPTPATSALATGFGVPAPVSVTVRSNTAWSVAVSSGAPFWTGTPGSARQNKPASDLQWGLSAGGAFTSLTATPVTVTSGTASSSATVPLHLRVAFNWAVDVAGSYRLPVTITLTAP